MSKELRQIGELMRKKRQEMHLTLKEVENSTYIRSGYLEAIEKGTISQYISGVYALGFIKQYANFLGLDTEKMMAENPTAFQMPPQHHEFAYGIGTLEMRGSLGGGVKWLPNLLWAGGAATFIVLIYYIMKALGWL